jgi:hypothetical protein
VVTLKGKKSMAIVLLSALGFASIGASCQGVETQASKSYDFHSIKPSNQYVRMAVPTNTFHIDGNKVEEVTEVITNPTEVAGAPPEPETVNHREDEVEEQTEPQTVSNGDYTYHKIVDDRFKSTIAIAEKYGASLYGIPESDGFMIYHDTVGTLLFMSTGAAVAELANADVIIDYFSTGNWTEYPGIVEGIHEVVETGQEVRVDLGDYIGYVITMDNGKIVVWW